MIGFGSPDRCHRIGSQTGAQSGVSFKLGKILRDTEKIPELGSCGGEEENTGRWCHLEVFLRRRRLKFLVGEAPPTDPLWHELRCFHGDCRTGGCTETCGWSWHTECLFSSTLPWSVSGKLQFVFLFSLDWRSLQNRPVTFSASEKAPPPSG